MPASPSLPYLTVLEPPTIERILLQAGRILAEVGVEVRGEALRRRLLDAGVPTDRATGRLLFPPPLLRQALAAAPASFTLYDRAGRAHAELGPNRTHFAPGSAALNVLDWRTGEHRRATTLDYVEYVRAADTLPHLSYLATAFVADDVPPGIADAWRLYLHLLNSTKPVVSGAFTEHGVPRMAEMMLLFRRDRADLAARPMSIFTVTATGHFRYGEDSCQNLLDCAEWGIPVEIVPVTLMGLIAPVTLVEATAFHTADVLAGVAMAQLVRPGAPVLFGGAPAAFHMRTTVSPMAAVEAMHLTAAYVAVGRHLGLPTQAYLALSESKALDAQAGAETFAGALLAVLAGVSSVSGPGMLDYVNCFSLPKLMLDDELCGQALHLARAQPPADDETAVALARELLAEGNLLTAKHTLRHWPTHLYLPSAVVDRTTWDQYRREGARSLLERAVAEVEARLAAYRPLETDPALAAELRRLVETGLEPGQSLPAVPSWRPPAEGGPSSVRHGRRASQRREA
ncbi:MAG: trimethylamine methyltransferase family protein [Caldilineales bacterium]|nr:trimethylamine methyltransferase family protein [Caldilineales bacterium]MDW8318215.1 trimethylamine methyltransferase family protein [Anaerolineae bacterium]